MVLCCVTCQSRKGTAVSGGNERWFNASIPITAGPFCSLTCVGAFQVWPEERQMLAVIRNPKQLARLLELKQKCGEDDDHHAVTKGFKWRELHVLPWRLSSPPPDYIAVEYSARFRLELEPCE